MKQKIMIGLGAVLVVLLAAAVFAADAQKSISYTTSDGKTITYTLVDNAAVPSSIASPAELAGAFVYQDSASNYIVILPNGELDYIEGSSVESYTLSNAPPNIKYVATNSGVAPKTETSPGSTAAPSAPAPPAGPQASLKYTPTDKTASPVTYTLVDPAKYDDKIINFLKTPPLFEKPVVYNDGDGNLIVFDAANPGTGTWYYPKGGSIRILTPDEMKRPGVSYLMSNYNNPAAAAPPSTYNVAQDGNGNYIFVNKADESKSVVIPQFMLGKMDPTKIGAFEGDGCSFKFTIDKKASSTTTLDKGDWTVNCESQNGIPYYRFSHSGGLFGAGTEFVSHPAAGMTVIENEKTNSQKVWDSKGNEVYYCNPILNLGACQNLVACQGDETLNCYGDSNQAIIMTGKGLWGDILKDSCFAGKVTMAYGADGNCYGVVTDYAGTAQMSFYDAKDKKLYEFKYDGTSFECKTGTTKSGGNTYGDCTDETKAKLNDIQKSGDLDHQLQRKRVSDGIAQGLEAADQIGQFFDMAKAYGWWKVDDNFLMFNKWFEDNIWFKQVTDPERYLCEIDTAYEDLVKDGFLPTSSGEAGADIQATRFLVTEINTTTLNQTSFYRYKVTYTVNGPAIVKKVSAYDMQGKPLEKREFSIVVLLDGINITGVIDLCVGKCSDKDLSSTGTSSLPIIIKSTRVFSKACIDFKDTGDLDPFVREYLRKNGNRVCNTVVDAFVPAVYVAPLAGSAAPAAAAAAGASAGPAAGGSSTGEIVI